MNKKVKSELVNEKHKLIKQKTDKFLKIFIIIFIVGYGIFFTSNIWMPVSSTNVETTKPGTLIMDDGIKIQLLKWSYSKEDEKIEVIIKRDNLSISDDNYKWTAFEKTKGILNTEMVVEGDSLIVIHINDIPKRWSAIGLQLQNGDKISNVRLYVTKKEVGEVKHILKLNFDEYQKLAINYLIDIYMDNLAKNNKEISKLEEKVAKAEVRILEIRENQKYETDLEKEESNRAIAEIESEITIMKNKTDDFISKNEEINKKIKLQKLKLK